jgi:Ca2+-binding EF-hand superfamily protein
MQNKEEAKVPPHSWLVLETSWPEARSTETSAYLDEGGENDGSIFHLAEAAGGGSIAESGAPLLRVVLEERLHSMAVEANFQRATRGTSVVALRHAAQALELVAAEEERIAMRLSPLDSMACLRTAPSPHTSFSTGGPATWSSWGSSEVGSSAVTAGCTMSSLPAHERLKRMLPIVAMNASAAGKRAFAIVREIPDLPGPPPGAFLRGKAGLLKGARALDDFMTWSQHRFGNPMRAWFALDPEENMRLGEQTFVRRCLDLGFRGNVRALWQYADSDRSGQIGILEIDANATMLMASFKKFVDDHWKGAVEAFSLLDTNRSGKISKDEFVAALKSWGFKGKSARLFDLLDRQGFGYMVASDVAFLEHWTPPPYLLSYGDEKGLKALRKACEELCGSLFNAWRTIFDRDGTMRVSWEEFQGACRAVLRGCFTKEGNKTPGMNYHSRPHDHGLPKTEQEMAAVWRALDSDCSGWISLREFDPPCFQVFAGFKRWADEHHAGVLRAFIAIDRFHNGNGRLTVGELRGSPLTWPPANVLSMSDVELLFCNLDVNSTGRLTEEEFRFLEHWDLDWEEWERLTRQRRAGRSSAGNRDAARRGTTAV